MTLHEFWDLMEACKVRRDEVSIMTLRWAAQQIQMGNYERGEEFPPRRQPTVWERIVAFLEI